MKIQYILSLFLILIGVTTAANTLVSSGLTDDQRQALLDAHNQLRNKVASGGQGSQPKAANMMAMNWDASLEATAQAWASNMSAFMTHSGNNKGYGENLAMNGSTQKTTYDPAYHVQMWFDEVNLPSWSTNYIDSYQFGSDYGHYSQVVWATSKSLGCGYSFSFDGQFYNHYTVCQYKAQGNYISQAVYKKGQPCTQCDTLLCNTKYTALCGPTNAVNSSSGGSTGGSSGGTSGGTSGSSTDGTSGGSTGGTSGSTSGGTSGNSPQTNTQTSFSNIIIINVITIITLNIFTLL